MTTLEDTLRFYFVKASRTLPDGKIYYSHNSDTVGYYQQFLFAYNGIRSANNLLAYPFDRGENGLKKMSDLYRNIEVTTVISSFLFEQQLWDPLVYLDFISIWNGNDNVLRPGNAYLVEVKKDVTVLMYGVLPKPYQYDFLINTNGKVSENLMLMPLIMSNCVKRQDLGQQIN